LDEKEAVKTQKADEKKAVDDMFENCMTKLKDSKTEFQDDIWSELVDLGQKITGAKAVYLGLLDEEGLEGEEPPCITYSHVTPGSEWMTETVLPKETGVTYGALKEKPPPEEMESMFLWKPPSKEPPPAPAEGEDAPPAEPEQTYFPVSVNCVTDNEKVNYFHMTRMGSYLAVPLVYTSYYSQDALAGAKKFLEEEREEARIREEEAEAARKKTEEDAAAGGGDYAPAEAAPVEAEALPEKELLLSGPSVKMVLCMDTLGSNTAFAESKFVDMLALCTACGECKSATEKMQIKAQAQALIDDERRAATGEEVARLREEAEVALQEENDNERAQIIEDGLEGDVKAAKEDVVAKKYKFFQSRRVLLDMKDQVMELMALWVTVPTEVINILAAICFLAEYTKDTVYPARKSALTWSKMKTVIDDAFFETIGSYAVGGARKNLKEEQKFKNVKAMLPADYDAEKSKEGDPLFEVIFTYLQSAIEYREGQLGFAKSEFERRKKEAEEADPPVPFDEEPLDKLDDDHAE